MARSGAAPNPPNDQVKFATYTRDSGTGLDYADQRYYASTFGRFMTPDPYRGSIDLKHPQSLNRYAYVSGRPCELNSTRVVLYLGSNGQESRTSVSVRRSLLLMEAPSESRRTRCG